MRSKKTIKKALLNMSMHEAVEYCHGMEQTIGDARRLVGDIKVNVHPEDRMVRNIVTELSTCLNGEGHA